MNLGSLEVPMRLVAGGIVILATLVLALTNNIDGGMAMLAILGVASALGVYQKVRSAEAGDGGE